MRYTCHASLRCLSKSDTWYAVTYLTLHWLLDLDHSHTLDRNHLNLLDLALDGNHLDLLSLYYLLLLNQPHSLLNWLLHNHHRRLLLVWYQLHRHTYVRCHSWLNLHVLNRLVSWNRGNPRRSIRIIVWIIRWLILVIIIIPTTIIIVRRWWRGGTAALTIVVGLEALLIGHGTTMTVTCFLIKKMYC